MYGGTFSILSCRPKEGGLEPLCDYSTGPLVYGASVVTLEARTIEETNSQERKIGLASWRIKIVTRRAER